MKTMYSIAPRYKGCVFDPEATHAMGVAYDRICELFRLAESDHKMKNIIAVAVINAASYGERDPGNICALAIQSSVTVLTGDTLGVNFDRKREGSRAVSDTVAPAAM
jgi:hypothetical protein